MAKKSNSHTVTAYNEMVGRFTLRFNSQAKTSKGLLRAAANRVASEMGGYHTIMCALTAIESIDGILV